METQTVQLHKAKRVKSFSLIAQEQGSKAALGCYYVKLLKRQEKQDSGPIQPPFPALFLEGSH